ncbi:MAG TPA: hypothetical protein VFJ22_02970 [Dermatophilaceae bacterium]|nr:hypothetical protein [Dermatophilaceae bacterium]
MTEYPQPYQSAPIVQPKNTALATIASFFVPGLGSLIIGRAGWGIAILVAYVLAWVSMLAVVGLLLVPLVWVWGMLDAYLGAQKWNREHGIVS